MRALSLFHTHPPTPPNTPAHPPPPHTHIHTLNLHAAGRRSPRIPKRLKFLRLLVCLVTYDSREVSFEHVLLSRHPSHG